MQPAGESCRSEISATTAEVRCQLLMQHDQIRQECPHLRLMPLDFDLSTEELYQQCVMARAMQHEYHVQRQASELAQSAAAVLAYIMRTSPEMRTEVQNVLRNALDEAGICLAPTADDAF